MLSMIELLTGDFKRMFFIDRFSSVPRLHRENVAEHTYHVMFVSYCMALDINRRLKGTAEVDMAKLLTRCMAHDLDESLSGDMIRCFSGDTKVALLDGRDLPFSEICEEFTDKQFWVYSYDTEKKKIVPGLASFPRKTGTTKTVVVTLDNKQSIKCTPEHLFMLRDGTYKEAKDLKEGDSLMPLYRHWCGGRNIHETYEFFLQEDEGWIPTHYMSAELSEGDKKYGNHRHHKNFDKKDNRPDNILWMTPEEHLKMHSDNLAALNIAHWTEEKYEPWRTRMRAISKKSMKKTADRLWADPEFRAMMKEVARENMIRLNSDPEMKARLIEISRETFNKMWADPEFRKTHSKRISEFTSKRHKEDPVYAEKIRSGMSRGVKKSWQENRELRVQKLKDRMQKSTEKEKLSGPAAQLKRKKTMCEKVRDILLSNGYDPSTEEGWESGRKELKKLGVLGQFSPSYSTYKKYNHKVVSVTDGPVEDVYDITVDKYHNFALYSGVFVHNSFKYGYPGLRQTMEKASAQLLLPAIQKLGSAITDFEPIFKHWEEAKSNDLEGYILQIADFTSVAYYAWIERSMGNTLIDPVLEEVKGWMQNKFRDFPEDIQSLMKPYVDDVVKMINMAEQGIYNAKSA